jgi:D-alanyl-D-alanine carboxypeptidase (penicillin-binding protein 5/6)
VWQGSSDTVPLTVQKPVNVTMTPEARAAMKVTVNYEGPVPAPIAKGQQVAILNVSAPNYPNFTVPLVAADDVGREGFVGRIFVGLHAAIAGHARGK